MKTTKLTLAYACLLFSCVTWAQNSGSGSVLQEDIVIDSRSRPVVLEQFNANPDNCSVEISWLTQHEKNNRGFKIERSNDLEHWEIIAVLEGMGNSAEITNYTYTDNAPQEGTNFYKIRQEDTDDAIRYTQILSATTSDNGCTETKVSYYPNPATDIIHLNLKETTSMMDRKLKICDANGRLIRKQNVKANNLSLGVQDLQAGLYYINIEGHQTFTFYKK